MEKWHELLVFVLLFLSTNIIIILICWFVSHALLKNRSSQAEFNEFDDQRYDGDLGDGPGGGRLSNVAGGRVSVATPTTIPESLRGGVSARWRSGFGGVASSASQLSRGSSFSSSDSSSQSDDEEDMSTAMSGHSRTRAADTRLDYRLSCLLGTALSEPKSLLHNLRTQEESESMAFRQELRNIRSRGTAALRGATALDEGGQRGLDSLLLLAPAQAEVVEDDEAATERVYSRYHALVPVQRFDPDYARLEESQVVSRSSRFFDQ